MSESISADAVAELAAKLDSYTRLAAVNQSAADQIYAIAREALRERDVARSELAMLRRVAGDVRKYWLDWPQERREAVGSLSQFLAAAIDRLAVQLSYLDEEGQR